MQLNNMENAQRIFYRGKRAYKLRGERYLTPGAARSFGFDTSGCELHDIPLRRHNGLRWRNIKGYKLSDLKSVWNDDWEDDWVEEDDEGDDDWYKDDDKPPPRPPRVRGTLEPKDWILAKPEIQKLLGKDQPPPPVKDDDKPPPPPPPRPPRVKGTLEPKDWILAKPEIQKLLGKRPTATSN